MPLGSGGKPFQGGYDLAAYGAFKAPDFLDHENAVRDSGRLPSDPGAGPSPGGRAEKYGGDASRGADSRHRGRGGNPYRRW